MLDWYVLLTPLLLLPILLLFGFVGCALAHPATSARLTVRHRTADIDGVTLIFTVELLVGGMSVNRDSGTFAEAGLTAPLAPDAAPVARYSGSHTRFLGGTVGGDDAEFSLLLGPLPGSSALANGTWRIGCAATGRAGARDVSVAGGLGTFSIPTPEDESRSIQFRIRPGPSGLQMERIP